MEVERSLQGGVISFAVYEDSITDIPHIRTLWVSNVRVLMIFDFAFAAFGC